MDSLDRPLVDAPDAFRAFVQAEARRRLTICALALVAAFFVAAFPVPGLGVPLTEMTILRIDGWFSGGRGFSRPGEGLRLYFSVVVLLTVALAQPVVLYQVLAFFTAHLRPGVWRLLAVAVVACIGAFCVGIVTGDALLPDVVMSLLTWNSAEIAIMLRFTEIIVWVATLILWTGIAFELPVLIASLVWLGIAGRDRLARLRPYALLAAFVIGAWITPTPDVLNQAIVAVPLYLAYEVGLLLARFVPTRAA